MTGLSYNVKIGDHLMPTVQAFSEAYFAVQNIEDAVLFVNDTPRNILLDLSNTANVFQILCIVQSKEGLELGSVGIAIGHKSGEYRINAFGLYVLVLPYKIGRMRFESNIPIEIERLD